MAAGDSATGARVAPRVREVALFATCMVLAGVLASVSLIGCERADPTAAALPHLDEATDLLDEYRAEDARIADALSHVPTGAVEPEEAQEALDKLEGVLLASWYQEELLSRADAALARAASVPEASEDLAAYVGAQRSAVAALEGLRASTEEYASALERLYAELARDDPSEEALAAHASEAAAARERALELEDEYAEALVEVERQTEPRGDAP